MVTIEEIAKKLGVNKSTVSKALRGFGDINRETAEKIRKAARELGYSKKLGKKNNMIAIVVPEIDNAIYSEIVNDMIVKAGELGYTCSVFSYNFDYNCFENILDGFTQNSIDGFFVIAENLFGDAFISSLTRCTLPFVLISSNDYGLDCDCVWINEKHGVEVAFEHLYSLGHRNFAFVGGRFGELRAGILKKVAEKYGVKIPDDNIIISEERGYDCGYNHAGELLEKELKVTAIIAQYDDIAFGAIKRLTEAGISVPKDVSVIGFDDAAYCKYSTPSLTTVNSEIEQLCRISLKILDGKITGSLKDSAFQSVLVRPKLVVRNSTVKAKSFETKNI